MEAEKREARRFRGRGIAALGLGALVLAVAAYWHSQRNPPPIHLTMSAGESSGLRHQLLLGLAREATSHQLQIRVTETEDWAEMIELVNDGTLDFALIQGGLDLSDHKNVYQAAALHVEPLHLLVKEEIYKAVSWDPLESTCRHASLSIL